MWDAHDTHTFAIDTTGTKGAVVDNGDGTFRYDPNGQFESLSLGQKLEKLRIIELSFIRQGRPDPDLAKLAVEKLNRLYPSDNEWMNRELSQLLIYLEAPDVVAKTLKLLDHARTQEEQVHYIFYLRNLKSGWTPEQRKHYFDWFRFAQEAGKGEVTYPAGSAYHVWANQAKASERQ